MTFKCKLCLLKDPSTTKLQQPPAEEAGIKYAKASCDYQLPSERCHLIELHNEVQHLWTACYTFRRVFSLFFVFCGFFGGLFL